VLVDVADQSFELLIGRYPVEKPRKSAIEHERLGPLRVAGGEERGKRSAF
jgi:hypothetical protein